MSFKKLYYFDFYRLNTTEKHTVEIWKDTDSAVTTEEITGMASPLVVEMPELENKFQVVRGKGCSLSLLSDTDGKFFDGLYHVNPLEFKVKHFINGALKNVYLLDSEMMQEPFDQNKNYMVSVTGNDGLALMDRFSFINTDETNYSGLKSKMELLQICLNKIGIWENACIYLSTTFTGSPGSGILFGSYVDCSNFYDEDNKPMTLRDVVESILAPYGAHIYAEKGNVYISDIHTKATENAIYYTTIRLSDLGLQATEVITSVKSITPDKYKGIGQIKELSGGVNRQVVCYSPFPIKTILENSLIGTDEFQEVPESYTLSEGYYQKILNNNLYWNIDLSHQVLFYPTVFESSFYKDEQDANVYIKMPNYEPQYVTVFSVKTNPFLTLSKAITGISGNKKYTKGIAFKITGEVLCRTKSNPYNEEENSTVDINNLVVACRLNVGGFYYDQTYNRFTDENTVFQIWTNDGGNSISDRFVPIGRNGKGMIIPIRDITSGDSISGEFHFDVNDNYMTDTTTNDTLITNSVMVMALWFKNLSIAIVNYDGSEIDDSDVEYIGNLDKNFLNEGEKITLTCGTDSQFSDRGKILKYDGLVYSDITEWTRYGQTYKIEELLLGSVCSNYRCGYITLNSMKLRADFSPMNILTEGTLTGIKLMVKSAKIDYYNDVCECDLVEISPDELIIEK